MIMDDTVHTIDLKLVTNLTGELMAWAYLMTQYNLKPGLRKFRAQGETAVINKMMQLHVMDTWTAMDPAKLTREERMKALSSLLFLKEKQTRKVKGRTCINRAPQRVYILKEEAVLPTVSMKSTFITATIAAHMKRAVHCYDIPSTFVNTDTNKEALMVLKRKLAELMI
jgi:hypothetical protein